MLLILITLAQATTVCTNYIPNQVECSTQSPRSDGRRAPSYPSYQMPSYQDQARQEAETRNIEAQTAALRAQSEHLELINRMSKLVAAGKCQEAIALGLAKGRMDLAAQAKELCNK